MRDERVGLRYARALFILAEESGQVERTEKELAQAAERVESK